MQIWLDMHYVCSYLNLICCYDIHDKGTCLSALFSLSLMFMLIDLTML